MSAASDVFRKAVLETQTIRQEYFNFQLPRILRVRIGVSVVSCLTPVSQSLKECADEIDKGLQYHLSRYAFLFESIILNDGTTLSPMGIEDGKRDASRVAMTNLHTGPGLRPTFQAIDNRADFRVFMQNYAVAYTGPRGPRREGPWQEGFVRPLLHSPIHSPTLTHTRFLPFSPTSSCRPCRTMVSARHRSLPRHPAPRSARPRCRCKDTHRTACDRRSASIWQSR